MFIKSQQPIAAFMEKLQFFISSKSLRSKTDSKYSLYFLYFIDEVENVFKFSGVKLNIIALKESKSPSYVSGSSNIALILFLIYSFCKIIYFRRQLINNFTEYNENIEYTRKKYNDAMKIGEIHEEKNFKLALKMEQKFYQNKFNILKNQNVKDIKNNINKIKQMHGYFRKSHFSRNTFKMSNTPAKKSKNSILNTFTNNDKNDNSNLKLLPEINKTPIKKPKSDEINLNLYNNKIKSILSRMKELSINEIKNEQVLKNFMKIHNSKARKAIKQRSKDLTDSIYEINDYPYEKLSSSYSKENVGNINMHNLARARKINIINKYLYNLEDDDLLIHNPKKLREEIKKVQNACNKTDYKANYNYSFLRKKLKLETIRKFNCIKDSQFGFPV